MKSILFTLSFFVFTSFIFSQSIYKATAGEISFFSETPIENIEAKNDQVKAIMNIEKKEIAVIVPVIGFKFEKPLMEEHFNENYMESEKYKTAQFSGTYQGEIDYKTDGDYPVTGKGKINIHGITQEREFSGNFKVEQGIVKLMCKFSVKLEDHKIKRPKIVLQNIAEEVDVELNINFEPK